MDNGQAVREKDSLIDVKATPPNIEREFAGNRDSFGRMGSVPPPNMNEPGKRGISRRQFARRAAVLSATASIAPAANVFADTLQTPPAQEPASTHPNLSPESHAEAEARYQQILSQYGDRFSAEEKASLREMNLVTQASLDKVRAFSLENGDGPALYLKPLVEREKKPVQPPAAAQAKKS